MRCSMRRSIPRLEAFVSDSRARIWFSLFVLAVFCLGGAGGFFVGRHVPSPRPDRPGLFGGHGGPGRGGPPPFGRGGPPPIPSEIVNRLASELQLDASQQDQVKKIVEDRRDRLEGIHREARERFDTEQRDLHAAIRAILRPEQQTRFDKFLDRRP